MEHCGAMTTVETTRDTVSATAVVDVPPAEVFEFLRRPVNHAEISGDGTVATPTAATSGCCWAAGSV